MRPTDTPEPGSDKPRPRRLSLRALGLLLLVAMSAYGLDQLTKYLVTQNLEIGDVVPVLGNVFQLHYVTNSGAAFSLASGFTWALSVLAIGILVVAVGFAPRIRSFAWASMFGLVVGGAFGNLTDRLTRPPGFGVGHVIDFLQIWGFPAIFNVADIAIVTSMGLFILLSLRGVGLDGRRDERTSKVKAEASRAADPMGPSARSSE